MIAVSKSLGATVANGALLLAIIDVNGMLLDPFAASFAILDANGGSVAIQDVDRPRRKPTRSRTLRRGVE